MKIVGRYCPACGNEGMTSWLGAYLGSLWHCPKCGYIGPVMIERDLAPTNEFENHNQDSEDKKDEPETSS